MPSKEWKEKNKERLRQYCLDWKKNHPNYRRDSLLTKKYGITAADYDRMLSAQSGCCAICRAKESGRGKHFFIDHDHETGRVRGLLCQACNTMLGQSRDNVSILRAGAAYLEMSRQEEK